VRNSLEFTEVDLPRERTQPEVVADKVRELFDGRNPVSITDVARALEMNYGTCKTHLHRAAMMNLLSLVKRKGFLPADGPRRKLRW
jgi:predicted ArsR family transcriptional regulator